jgi:hypothetical protein
MDIKEIWCSDVDWTHLAEDGDSKPSASRSMKGLQCFH